LYIPFAPNLCILLPQSSCKKSAWEQDIPFSWVDEEFERLSEELGALHAKGVVEETTRPGRLPVRTWGRKKKLYRVLTGCSSFKRSI
jgi:hypothetical protein